MYCASEMDFTYAILNHNILHNSPDFVYLLTLHLAYKTEKANNSS